MASVAATRGLLAEVALSREALEDGTFRRRIEQVGRALALSPQQQPELDVLLSEEVAAGGGATALQPEQVVRALGVLYDALAQLNPRALAVPLTALAGWGPEDVAGKARAAATLVHATAPAPTRLPAPSTSTSQQLVVLAPPEPPAVPSAGHQGDAAAPAQAEHVQLPRVIWPGADDGASPGAGDQPPLLFDHVAVGGTFDRLHCGHELLLATTALVARRRVYVGITADKLLVNKNHRELLQPYEQRSEQALRFVRAVRPHLEVSSGALTDPKEPTQAELDPAMQALVVSQETLPGGLHINEGRVRRGFAPLVIVVVPVIGSHDPRHKLSSTQLRADDAAAKQEVVLR